MRERLTVEILIAFIRGINVGGQRRLPMEELREMLGSLGAKDTKTYIQSGNAVFRFKAGMSSHLSTAIAARIKQQKGFEPHVIVLTHRELDRAISRIPWPSATTDPGRLHLGFLASSPPNPDVAALESLREKSERFHLSAKVLYVCAPKGLGRSRLAQAAEKHLGVPMTIRNCNTVREVQRLARALR